MYKSNRLTIAQCLNFPDGDMKQIQIMRSMYYQKLELKLTCESELRLCEDPGLISALAEKIQDLAFEIKHLDLRINQLAGFFTEDLQDPDPVERFMDSLGVDLRYFQTH